MTISLKEQFDRSNIETIIKGFYDELDCEIGNLCNLHDIDQFEVYRNEQGLIHRDDGPAIIGRSSTSEHSLAEAWYRDGFPHRDMEPALIIKDLFAGKEELIQSWYQNGVQHREHGPSVIHTQMASSGPVVHKEKWFLHGLQHRLGGPAEVHIDTDTGVIYHEFWYQHGRSHRDDGPADISRDLETGYVYDTIWSVHGVMHRADGPAFLSLDRAGTGEVIHMAYYHGGIDVTKQFAPKL